MSNSNNDTEKTKKLMGALVRMKPKPHDEMKVGKKMKPEKPPKKPKPQETK